MNKNGLNFFYRSIRSCFKVIFKLLFRIEIQGSSNIPKHGALIICSNHISYWDPPLVGTLVGDRVVHFMAKAELFEMFLLKHIITKLGAFPVKRDIADRRAIKKAVGILQEGGIIGLFPEGTRSKTGELQEAFNGPALLAVKTNSPVLPVAITGPYKLFSKVRVNIGKPLFFKGLEGQKIKGAQLNELSGQIMQEIAQLLWNNDKI